jgi:hypothetical protein
MSAADSGVADCCGIALIDSVVASGAAAIAAGGWNVPVWMTFGAPRALISEESETEETGAEGIGAEDPGASGAATTDAGAKDGGAAVAR